MTPTLATCFLRMVRETENRSAYFEIPILDLRRRFQASKTMPVATRTTGTTLILIFHVPTATGPGSYATNCSDWSTVFGNAKTGNPPAVPRTLVSTPQDPS